jgi:hypothetical protein
VESNGKAAIFKVSISIDSFCLTSVFLIDLVFCSTCRHPEIKTRIILLFSVVHKLQSKIEGQTLVKFHNSYHFIVDKNR